MKKSQKGFRSKFGGYNKKDVNEYILSENKKFAQLENDYLTQIIPRDEKIKALEATISSNQDVIFNKEVEISTLNAKISTLESKLKELEEKEVLRQPLDDEIVEKAEKYDSISGQLDDILAYAKEEANKIIDEAKTYSKNAKKSHSTSSETIKKDVNKKSTSILDEIKKAFKLLK